MLKTLFKNFFLYIFGAIAILLFKFLALFFNLKLARLHEKRIGHLIFDAEQILRTKKKDEIILVSYFDHEICNSYIHKLIKKNFFYSKYFNILHHPKIKKIFTDYDEFVFDLKWQNGVSRNLAQTKPQLKSSLKQNEWGVNFIKSIGLNPKKIVAIIVRDSAFLPELNHHSYRDCEIENYYPLITFLLNQGYSVIRMGKQMNSKASISHPLFYDYAFSKRKSDYLDVWIMMNAYEVITTGTGLENITDISNRPYIGLNYTPLLHYNSWNSLFWWAPKILCYKNTTTPVPLSEQIKSGSINFMLSDEYYEAGYVFKEINSHLNISIIEEVLQRRANIYNDLFEKERFDIHQKFLESDLFETMHENKKNFNLSSEFIKENLTWLLK